MAVLVQMVMKIQSIVLSFYMRHIQEYPNIALKQLRNLFIATEAIKSN